jgi:hypothetical protein
VFRIASRRPPQHDPARPPNHPARVTTRLLPAILPALLLGCSHPKATVVAEPPPRRAHTQANPAAAALPGDELTLRDPDVVSELPELRQPASATRPAAATPESGTVIARPPEPGQASQ